MTDKQREEATERITDNLCFAKGVLQLLASGEEDLRYSPIGRLAVIAEGVAERLEEVSILCGDLFEDQPAGAEA